MTALTEVQKIWANNSEMKEKTGILMWDLSAACVQFENPCPLPQSAWEGFGIYGRWKMDKQILLRRVKATIRLSLRRASHICHLSYHASVFSSSYFENNLN